MTSAYVPGRVLLGKAAFLSLALVVWNDLWLKRHHPGILSGKLSDVGLCVFLPIFVAALFEWADEGAVRTLARPRLPARHLHLAGCAVAVLVFVLVKCIPAATSAHVALLSSIVPQLRFRAVTDPTDLVCLPAVFVAWRALALTRGDDERNQRLFGRSPPG